MQVYEKLPLFANVSSTFSLPPPMVVLLLLLVCSSFLPSFLPSFVFFYLFLLLLPLYANVLFFCILCETLDLHSVSWFLRCLYVVKASGAKKRASQCFGAVSEQMVGASKKVKDLPILVEHPRKRLSALAALATLVS